MVTKMAKGLSNLTLLKELNSTIKRLSIYPGDHPAVKLVLKETSELFQEFFKTKPEIVLGKVENKLVIDGETLDASLISEKVWNTLETQKIKSMSFCQGLSQEELRSLLEFFLKKEQEDFSAYLEKNKISHVKLNRLHYEVISDDEKVVKTELVDKLQLKSELSKVIKEHPELLKDILLGKIIDKERLKVLYKGTGASSGQGGGEEGSSTAVAPGAGGGGEGAGQGEGAESGGVEGGGTGEGAGGDIDFKKTLEEIKAEIESLSDDEIVALLTYQVKQTLDNMPETEESSDETLRMVKKVLEKRDRQKLLPQLKELLADHGIIEEQYFDLLLNETWQEEKAVGTGLDLLKKLEKNQIDNNNLEQSVKDIIRYSDQELKSKIVDALLEKLDSKEEQLRKDSAAVLGKMIEVSISEEREEDFVYIKEKLLAVPVENVVSLRFYQGYFEILQLVFSGLNRKGNLVELKKLLGRIDLTIQAGERVPELTRLKMGFIAKISTEHNLNLLIQSAIADFNSQKGKELEEVLESFEKGKVAQKLLEVFTVEQRNVRLWALRVLSRLGEDSVEAISLHFASADEFKRPKDHGMLADEAWYKTRNALFVLGNIESQKALDLLGDFKNSPDPRVRLEVLKALEKKRGEKANGILSKLLQDKEEEVHKKALSLISASGDKVFLSVLEDAFLKTHHDRKKLFAAMLKIGPEDCKDLALKLVVEEGFPPGDIPKKEKEELQIIALNLLETIADQRIFSTLESYLRKRKKGLLGILYRDDVSIKIAKILSMKDKEIEAPRL